MFFLKKKHSFKNTYQQRDATNEHCEVLNMNFDI